jgi:hypothetical protein
MRECDQYTGAIGIDRTPQSSTLPSYRAPSQSQGTYLFTNPYTGPRARNGQPAIWGPVIPETDIRLEHREP